MQDRNKKENSGIGIAIVGTIIIFMLVVMVSKMFFLRNDFWILGVISIIPSIVGGAIGCGVAPTNNEGEWFYSITHPGLLAIWFATTVIIIFFTTVIFSLEDWIMHVGVSFVCFYMNAGVCAIIGNSD